VPAGGADTFIDTEAETLHSMHPEVLAHLASVRDLSHPPAVPAHGRSQARQRFLAQSNTDTGNYW
jgi:hypothetical protein